MAGNPEAVSETITFELDGRPVTAHPGETILQAAKRAGVDIPHLCYKEGMRPDGNCRACMVEIEGERVLAPSCWRPAQDGMVVGSRSERARHSQRLVLELLQSDMTGSAYTRRSELEEWSRWAQVGTSRFAPRHNPPPDLSHPAMAVNLDACIQCTRCVRACREVQANDVIGYAFRGNHSKIVFDFDDPMGESSCVGCGECVQACPTGALMPAQGVGLLEPDERVESVCPYCGVGCLLSFNVKDRRILHVEGRDGPSNHGRLCVKGRYGFDYIHHPHRLTKPLIRRDDAPKDIDIETLDPADPSSLFREADWEEALEAAASGLRGIRDERGASALAGFGSAKGSNEEAYLFQKLVRTGFGTNNVDHCTRLCHASSVAAMLECIGSGAVSNPVRDVSEAELFIVIGASPTDNHPVAATFMKNAARAGKTLIVIDPRRSGIAGDADYYLQFRPDTDLALLNAMLNVIVTEGLVDEEFIAKRTTGFEALERHLRAFPPERMAPVCGIDPDTIRRVARLYATSRGSMIFWGMGISQHTHGTDNVRALISLALVTGQIGRRGAGLHPLRGQNNVQGASDVGLIPMVFPDYHKVDDAQARKKFEAAWGARLDPRPGLTVVEIVEAIHAGKLHGMYIMGENPAMSDPNLAHAREALAKLDHLVVQDLFLTETACYADVVLPASGFPEKTGTFTNTDRQVQLARRALDPPQGVRQDLELIQEIARRMGLDWRYEGPAEVFAEMHRVMPSIAGITWERLEREHSVVYPCASQGASGEEVLFREAFHTADGKGRLVPATPADAAEMPSDDFPWVLITGRQLEHWHTGAMTRRARVLDAIEPEPVASLSPDDLARLGVEPGERVVVSSRRGSVTMYARLDSAMQPGQVFLPFAYHEAAANLLTNEALDPFGKIPEFKFCAVRVEPPAKGRRAGAA